MSIEYTGGKGQIVRLLSTEKLKSVRGIEMFNRGSSLVLRIPIVRSSLD